MLCPFVCICRVFACWGWGSTRLTGLEVEVESVREWSRCQHCGFRCQRVWDRRPKRVRDLGVSGRRTTLVWRRRRFECGNWELLCQVVGCGNCG